MPTNDTERLVKIARCCSAGGHRVAAERREVCRLDVAAQLIGLNTQCPDIERADLARHPPPPRIGTTVPSWRPIPATKEQGWHIPTTAKSSTATAGSAADTSACKVKDALALEEELPFLGEEQAEASQVHLLLVHLDLREVVL